MNYLLLSAGGVGGNFLTQSLMVYLNCAGVDYQELRLFNTGGYIKDEITVNDSKDGLNSVHYKDFFKNNSLNLVTRLPYEDIRLISDKYSMVECLKHNHQKILHLLRRDVFSHALSMAIRSPLMNKFGTNAYNVKSRENMLPDGITFDIDINIFTQYLETYDDFNNFMLDEFPNATKIYYEDLNNNIDTTLHDITHVESPIIKKFKFSIDEYAKIMYHYSQTKQIDKITALKLLKFKKYQHDLIDSKKMSRPIPIKLTTLSEKKNSIVNFAQCLGAYNQWAGRTNYYSQYSAADIDLEINKENLIYRLTTI